MRAFSMVSHPVELASMLGRVLPRYGATPAAAIVGAGLTWGDATALVDGRGSVSYRQLAAAAGRLAAGLYGGGIVRAGTRVGLIADDDRWMLTALAAVGLCGGTVWLVNPRMGSDDLARLWRDNGIEVVIHADHCAERIGEAAPVLLSMGDCSRLVADSAGLPVPRFSKQSRFVMLTGGTTAAPASVHIKTRWSAPLPVLALAGATKIRHGWPTLLCAPCFHGYGLAVAVLALVAGSPLILSSACRAEGLSAMNKGGAMNEQGAARLDWGEAIFAVARRHRAATIVGVPAQLRSLAGYLATAAPPGAPREAVRTIVSGSDRLDRATIEALQARWGPVVVNYYGTTESGTVTMISGSDLQDRPDSVGRPVAGSRVRVLGRAGRVLPRGQIGRVQAVSPMASLGHGGWAAAAYTTSDLGWLDADGHLHLFGRLGPARAGGEFVDPARVETVLAGFDEVAWARARLAPDPVYGQRVVVEVGLADDAEPVPEPVGPVGTVPTGPTPTGPDLARWRAEVRARLGPAYVPARITVRSRCAPSHLGLDQWR